MTCARCLVLCDLPWSSSSPIFNVDMKRELGGWIEYIKTKLPNLISYEVILHFWSNRARVKKKKKRELGIWKTTPSNTVKYLSKEIKFRCLVLLFNSYFSTICSECFPGSLKNTSSCSLYKGRFFFQTKKESNMNSSNVPLYQGWRHHLSIVHS